MTFLARSRGVLPLVSSRACNFATESSCAIAGGSTKTLSRVAGLMPPKAKSQAKGWRWFDTPLSLRQLALGWTEMNGHGTQFGRKKEARSPPW